ncbi:receptor kinase-like protein Xa21 [Papaver somniferum]|uniref:receptor kinase-like protein Xa21 n=1 Tax=Papaver somniferum TaxID=3469 RepID=UPI000E702A49|nr:receptor kinase-like protein Xa21 [Papaver somniferum]
MEIKLLAWHPSSYILLLVSMLTLIISYKSTEIHCLAAVNDNNSNDRLALIAFKREITQDPLGILSSWNNRSNSLHLCEWRGVTCSGSRVSVLDLNSQGLVGSISPYIGNLSFLKDFFLYNNSLNGELPQQIGRLLRLKRIDLSYNFLKGEIPENISNCSNLRNLELSNNKLVGSIPHKLGSFHNLITLGLHDNNLSGEIPSSLGNLSSSLTVLDVGYNFNLKGRIPSTLSQLTSLKILGLDSNKFSGIVPSSLYNISSSLEVFSLMDNQLHGSIPSDIGSTLPNLTYFSVAVNNFTGTIPSSFSNMSKLEKLQLGTNNFVGSVPLKFGNLKSLKSKSVLPIMPLDVSIRFKGVSYNELFKATNGFNDSTNLLGKGSFGSVYKGVLQDESNPVAVKVLHLQQRGATKSFIAECDALRKVRHRNLLRILTCCSSNDFKALVFKFMANGSLENWLHPTMSDTNNNDQLQVKNLNLKRRLNIAVDVASAVKYLHHDCESPLVHCDLKPSNVLLDDDLVARVGDFGLAKFLPHTYNDSRQLNGQDASSIAIKGSIGYVSPEYGMGGEVSTLGDVYSYGILLLEMFTGKRPTDDMFKDGLDIHNFSKMHAFPERVLDIVDSRLLLELDGEDLHNNETNNYNMRRCERRNRERHTTRKILASIIEIGVICSSELPSDRINMNEILVDVQAVKNQFLGIGM